MAVNRDDFSRLIADLQQQRRVLEKNLDDTDRSSRSTQEIIDKITALKERAARLAASTPVPKPGT